MKKLAGVIGVLVIASLPAVSQAVAAPVEASSLAPQVRSLAENVLGGGTVKSISITDHGATVLMRWESATYKAENKQDTTRELMYAEAQLATGSVLGRLTEVTRIRFAILWKGQMMASGENWRGRGVMLTFAPALGAGTYKPPPEPKSTSKSGGTEAAKD